MEQYLNLMKIVRTKGNEKKDRTNVGTLSIFGYQMRFNLKKGFPILTTKYCHLKSIIYELLWFINGDTNISFLKKHGVSIWNLWADKNGDLGPIYGEQWRSWKANNQRKIDQLKKIIYQLKKDPNSRRIILSSWNVGELDKMSLFPCHILCQFYVLKKYLSCQLYQRSCDVFLGLPFNIASYALLVHMLAQQCNLKVHELIWTGGDIHLYKNHLLQADIQLSRKPKKLPKLFIKRKPISLFKYKFEDFAFINYNPESAIKAPIAK